MSSDGGGAAGGDKEYQAGVNRYNAPELYGGKGLYSKTAKSRAEATALQQMAQKPDYTPGAVTSQAIPDLTAQAQEQARMDNLIADMGRVGLLDERGGIGAALSSLGERFSPEGMLGGAINFGLGAAFPPYGLYAAGANILGGPTIGGKVAGGVFGDEQQQEQGGNAYSGLLSDIERTGPRGPYGTSGEFGGGNIPPIMYNEQPTGAPPVVRPPEPQQAPVSPQYAYMLNRWDGNEFFIPPVTYRG